MRAARQEEQNASYGVAPAAVAVKKPEISTLNTTLIGDYISTVFPEYSSKWLVQAQGNTTFTSTLQNIHDGLITVNRQYVFFQIGGNQIRSATSAIIFDHILSLVVAVRECNATSRIFFIAVLPRPVEDQQAKPFIAKFNRWMANNVERVDKLFGKVKFLPVQHHFLDGNAPKIQLFRNDDALTLNEAGAATFRSAVFRHAGFVKNVV